MCNDVEYFEWEHLDAKPWREGSSQDAAYILHLTALSITIVLMAVAWLLDVLAYCKRLWHVAWPFCQWEPAETTPLNLKSRREVWNCNVTVWCLRMAIAAPLGHQPHDISLVSRRHNDDQPSKAVMLMDKMTIISEFKYMETLDFTARAARIFPVVHPILRDFLFSYVQPFLLRGATTILEIWAGFLAVSIVIALITDGKCRGEQAELVFLEVIASAFAGILPSVVITLLRSVVARHLVHIGEMPDAQLQRIIIRWVIGDIIVVVGSFVLAGFCIVAVNDFLEVATDAHRTAYMEGAFGFVLLSLLVVPLIKALLAARVVQVFLHRGEHDPFRESCMIKLGIGTPETRAADTDTTNRTKQKELDRAYTCATTRAAKIMDKRAALVAEITDSVNMEDLPWKDRDCPPPTTQASGTGSGPVGGIGQPGPPPANGGGGQSWELQSLPSITSRVMSRRSPSADGYGGEADTGAGVGHDYTAPLAGYSPTDGVVDDGDDGLFGALDPDSEEADIAKMLIPIREHCEELRLMREELKRRSDEAHSGRERLRKQLAAAASNVGTGSFSPPELDASAEANADRALGALEEGIQKAEMNAAGDAPGGGELVTRLRFQWLNAVQAVRAHEAQVQKLEEANVTLRKEWMKAVRNPRGDTNESLNGKVD